MCIETIKLNNAGNRPRLYFNIYFDWGHRVMQTAGSSKTGFVRLYLVLYSYQTYEVVGYTGLKLYLGLYHRIGRLKS